MTTEQAELFLSDENIRICALVLTSLDRLQEEDFNLMEPELRKLSKFSESDVINATDKALEGHSLMSIPGNGNKIKMNLSVFLRGLQLLGKTKNVETALKACEDYETLAS